MVDPLVGTTRLYKDLMDGGSASTSCTLKPSRGWGLPVTSSKVAHTHSTEWSRENNLFPSGRLICPSPLETQASTATK
jgi:hypothetical protein